MHGCVFSPLPSLSRHKPLISESDHSAYVSSLLHSLRIHQEVRIKDPPGRANTWYLSSQDGIQIVPAKKRAGMVGGNLGVITERSDEGHKKKGMELKGAMQVSFRFLRDRNDLTCNWKKKNKKNFYTAVMKLLRDSLALQVEVKQKYSVNNYESIEKYRENSCSLTHEMNDRWTFYKSERKPSFREIIYTSILSYLRDFNLS